MVDRIVPATTEADRERISAEIGLDDAWPVKTEPFMQWVVEDHFPQGRPSWEKFGVEMVKDVRPYEEMKLRLLNGSHSGMAYLGLLCGRESISDAFADRDIRGFVDRLRSIYASIRIGVVAGCVGVTGMFNPALSSCVRRLFAGLTIPEGHLAFNNEDRVCAAVLMKRRPGAGGEVEDDGDDLTRRVGEFCLSRVTNHSWSGDLGWPWMWKFSAA
jgi:hypothetical protein